MIKLNEPNLPEGDETFELAYEEETKLLAMIVEAD